MKFLDLNISSIVLDPNKNIIRQAPRLEKDQQDNYKELFDYYTLFSDIFYNVDGDIELLGPPLLNLKVYVVSVPLLACRGWVIHSPLGSLS